MTAASPDPNKRPLTSAVNHKNKRSRVPNTSIMISAWLWTSFTSDGPLLHSLLKRPPSTVFCLLTRGFCSVALTCVCCPLSWSPPSPQCRRCLSRQPPRYQGTAPFPSGPLSPPEARAGSWTGPPETRSVPPPRRPFIVLHMYLSPCSVGPFL